MENTSTTNTSPNIFEMNEEDLYDDEESVNEEKPHKAKKKKNTKTLLLIALAVSCILTLILLVSFIGQNKTIKELNVKLEQLTLSVQEKQGQIENLNTVIAQKDKELEELKKPVPQSETPTASGQSSGTFGKDGDFYVVISPRGFNIRAEANSNSEVVASLAQNDEFEQKGDIIRLNDGSIWVELAWDNGYGCLQDADGTINAKLKQ